MDYQILNLLMRFNKEFTHKKIKKYELTDTECMICSYVYSHEQCSQEDIVNALRIDKTTIGKALASLEGKECIVRIKDSIDKRIKRVELTEKGCEKIVNLINLHNEWLSEVISVLNEKEKKQFEGYCERLLAEAEQLSKREGE